MVTLTEAMRFGCAGTFPAVPASRLTERVAAAALSPPLLSPLALASLGCERYATAPSHPP